MDGEMDGSQAQGEEQQGDVTQGGGAQAIPPIS